MEAVDARVRWARLLSLLGVFFTFAVVLLGAWTRLVDAGLGCPDWPGCYGQLVVPDNDVALAHSPDIPLQASKAWMEMIHRYVATGLGVLVLVLTLLAWRMRRLSRHVLRTSLLLLSVIVLQGAFGALTVTLKLWPQVVTLHLLGGLSVMLLFLWLHLRWRQVGCVTTPKRLLRPKGLWLLAIALLIGQLALGGWTSSNYAGLACQGFPTCNGQWWPAMDWAEGLNLTQTIGPSYLYGQLHAEARTAIHMAHRLGAVALGVVLLLLTWRYRKRRRLRPYLAMLLGGYGLQLALGIANVLLWLPLGLALAHTAGAALLVLAMTLTIWCVANLPDGLTHEQGMKKELSHA